MPGDQRKKGLKSVTSGKPLRSRGFLSQPSGGQVIASSDKQDPPMSATGHHKSRGARQVSVSTDGKPQHLSVKPKIKPYALEDE